MKRSILNAEQSAFLTATFDRNRDRFGGFRMMADDGGDGGDTGDKGGDTGDKGTGKSGDAGGKDGGDEPLGEAGKKALEAEREARKAAEDQIKTVKAELDGFKSALGEALGIKPKEGGGQQDTLTAVQEQLAAMQRESSVLKLANQHKITDEKDLELLATAKDADSMRILAERLAPGEQDSDARSRRPKPDASQGGAAGRQTKGGLTSLSGAELYDRLHPKKQAAS